MIEPNKMHSFTCLTCRISFHDADTQKQHYKTDWHRYNLKRMVAQLPPVTCDAYEHRMLQQKESERQSKQASTVYCSHCQKNFKTLNAYENHLTSRKHRVNACLDDHQSDSVLSTGSNLDAKFTPREIKRDDDDDSDGMEIEEVDSDEWFDDAENPIENNDCLFCKHHSASLVKNLAHMSLAHSFFVPDVEYCTSIEELVKYLGLKISAGFECIWCGERGRHFRSFEAVQQHMVDKGHCRMLHEGEALAEYAEFYDYSSSYPEGEVPDESDEVEVEEIDGSGFQLVLPSGAVIGHRSLMRYYKQKINPNRALVLADGSKQKVLNEYRLAGWKGSDRISIARKLKDLNYLQRVKSRTYVKLGMKANKFMPHFRRQVNF